MVDEQLIESGPQQNWGWPVALNFVLGGAGAGGFVFSFMLAGLAGNEGVVETKAGMIILLAMPSLVVLGFLCLSLEAGKTKHSRFLLNGVGSSWMSREVLAFILFIAAAVVSVFVQSPFLIALAAVSALFLLVSHGFILAGSRGIPAWRNSIIPLVVLSSGLSAGAGIAIVLGTVVGIPFAARGIIVAILLALVNSVVWLFYSGSLKTRASGKAMPPLQRIVSFVFIVGAGHVLPVLLLVFYLGGSGAETAPEGEMAHVMAAGLLLSAATAWQKVAIIFFAGHQQEIRLVY